MPDMRDLSTQHGRYSPHPPIPRGWNTVACILIMAVTAVLMTGIIVTGSTDSVRQLIESLLMLLLGVISARQAARRLSR
jgi:hypothetical protein